MRVQEVIRRPLTTEKAQGLNERFQTLAFEVHPKATKIEIGRAVEAQFKVKVATVRVAHMHGKPRNAGRGHSPDWKKAYVRLAPGEKTIDFHEII